MVGATVSTGMAFSTQGAFELPAMLLQADQALYRAKHDGRNRLAVAAPEHGSRRTEQPPAPQGRADRTPQRRERKPA